MAKKAKKSSKRRKKGGAKFTEKQVMAFGKALRESEFSKGPLDG